MAIISEIVTLPIQVLNTALLLSINIGEEPETMRLFWVKIWHILVPVEYFNFTRRLIYISVGRNKEGEVKGRFHSKLNTSIFLKSFIFYAT